MCRSFFLKIKLENLGKFLIREEILMTPIFKCLICRKDIERSKKTFWKKKGHLLCSSCLDNMKKTINRPKSVFFKIDFYSIKNI